MSTIKEKKVKKQKVEEVKYPGLSSNDFKSVTMNAWDIATKKYFVESNIKEDIVEPWTIPTFNTKSIIEKVELNKPFKEGDLVFIRPSSNYYGKSMSNPADKVGTISSILSSETIIVDWGDNNTNGYLKKDLIHKEDYSFKQVKKRSLSLGDSVKISKKSGYYSSKRDGANPPGTKGIIIHIDNDNEGNLYKVEWTNHQTNYYRTRDLLSYEDYELDILDFDSFDFKTAIKKEVKTLVQIKNVTIGSDFELFLYNKDIKEVINAKPYVKGSKWDPFNFDKSDKFWCTSLDNILAEMNIPPAISEEEFDKFVEKAIKYVQSTLPDNITTLATPAMYIKEEFLNTPESREFGCTPSYNAYTNKENPQPKGGETNLRTGAFHIHLKYDNMDFFVSSDLIKMLDLYLGLPSILIEPPNDRRKLYGTPGEFRFDENKTTEYRVLSNYFSRNSELRSWVFRNTMLAIDKFNTSGPLPKDMSQNVKRIIERADQKLAEDFVDKYNIPLLRQTA